MNASVSSCNCVDEVVTSKPPNCGNTSPGVCTGWTIAPFWSVVPYVANASVVAGVQTGSEISAASLNLPARDRELEPRGPGLQSSRPGTEPRRDRWP